ncbi:MAG TPA: prepilin-type N-terminal cleavage/methylation domain-containing protein [Acidothermaceae bacterium]|jgi:type II secretory pathway pseudopilin PulG
MAIRRRLRQRDESGFTLVELLVASVVGIIVGGVVLSTILVAQRSTNSTTAWANLNGEARVLLNRLAGDLRQATPLTSTSAGVTTDIPAITNVQNPQPYGTAGALTSITFDADFSGDDCVKGVLSDKGGTPGGCTDPSVDPNNPEVETFCWDPAGQVVYLIPGGVTAGSCTSDSGLASTAMLSGHVKDVKIYAYSSRYIYDGDIVGLPADGVTDWREIDHAGSPIGNSNDKLDQPSEYALINSVKIVVTVADGGHTQTVQTLVSLRNVP